MTEAYRDPTASTADRVADLLGRMTVGEKVAQLSSTWVTGLVDRVGLDGDKAAALLGHGMGQITRIGGGTGLRPAESAALVNQIQRFCVDQTRLGIPVVVHEEAVGGFLHRDATQYPQALGLAATWDPPLIEEITAHIRSEMVAVGARFALSPVFDVARDPRWGRVEETYGESPYLCGRMGTAFVRGLQTDDLTAGVVCAGKHFLGYAASIGGRNHAPVHLGPRELREVHAEPFAAAIRDAGLAGMMNSYTSVDGVPCAGSKEILTDLLRGELGFDGVVVADYFAVMLLHVYHHVAEDLADAGRMALVAGLDVELPQQDCYGGLVGSVAAGDLDEAALDVSVERVLAQKIALGLFEDPFVDAEAAPARFDTDAARSVARRAAAQSVCLLSNDGVLPLDRTSLGRVAVIGPCADDQRLLQGDYHYPAHVEISFDAGAGAHLLPTDGGAFAPGPYFTHHVTPLAGLRAALGDTVNVVHERGCHVSDTDGADIDAAAAAAQGADVAVVCVGGRSGLTTEATVGEMRDAVSLDLTGAQNALVDAVAATGTPTVVVVVSGRVHTLGDVVAQANAVAVVFPPGEEGGSAIGDVLTGAVEPGGRLPVTLPRHVGQVPLHHDMRAGGNRAQIHGEYSDSPVSPLFPFGHGLGYTTWAYGGLVGEGSTTADPIDVSVDVTNTGDRAGSEVVQVYVRDEVASVARPIRQLVGFARVEAGPGETATVRFIVHPSRLAFYDAAMRFVTEPGRFRFFVGPSSQSTLSVAVDLTGEVAEYLQREIVDTDVTITASARREAQWRQNSLPSSAT